MCLVLHYLEDWSAPLAELRRVLAPGGRLIVVVNHKDLPSATAFLCFLFFVLEAA